MPQISVQSYTRSTAGGAYYQPFISNRKACPIAGYIIDTGRQPQLAVSPDGVAPSAWQWYDTGSGLYNPIDIVAHSLRGASYDAAGLTFGGVLLGAGVAILIDVVTDLFGLSITRNARRRRRALDD